MERKSLDALMRDGRDGSFAGFGVVCNDPCILIVWVECDDVITGSEVKVG